MTIYMKMSHNEMRVTLSWKHCTRISLSYLKVLSQTLQSGTEIGKNITLNCQSQHYRQDDKQLRSDVPYYMTHIKISPLRDLKNGTQK
jgi:hypothetical protein